MSISQVTLREPPLTALGARSTPFRSVSFTNKVTALSAAGAYNHALTLPAESTRLKLIQCNSLLNLEFMGALMDSSTPVSKSVTLRLWGMVPLVVGKNAPPGTIPTADYQEWIGRYLGKYTLECSASTTTDTYPTTGSKLLTASSQHGAWCDAITANEDVSPTPNLRLIGETAPGAVSGYIDKGSTQIIIAEALMASGTGTKFDLLYREI